VVSQKNQIYSPAMETSKDLPWSRLELSTTYLEAILPVRIIRMELNLSDLPDDVIHVPGFDGEDGGVA
jgi:hypothetical protein